MEQTETTHETMSEATTRSVGVQRLVMRSCPGCGEELLEDEEYFGVCEDCKEGASDLEELMDIALGEDPDEPGEMPDGTSVYRQGW